MKRRTTISVISKSHRYLFSLFTLGTLLLSHNHSVGQSLTIEPGSPLEKRVSRGERQEVRVMDARGSLQWQQSADGINWLNVDGKTENSIEVEVTDSLFFRCAILEAHCGLVYSDAVKLIPYEPATEIPGTSSDGNKGTFTAPLTTSQVTVTTTVISSITLTSGWGGGSVSAGAGVLVTARGVCWSSTSSNPSTDNPKTINGTGTGLFTSNLTGLTGNTTYYVRAYATTSSGTVYGDYVKFKTTPGLGLATVTTAAPSAITTTTAVSGGNVISSGGSGITARGVCWSTTANPTTSNSIITNGSGTGAYSSTLTGLAPNTTYHVRAWAQNSAGTAYGNDIAFTTSGNSAALSITTTSISAPTLTSATGGGTVTGGTGVSVSARGVCWSHTSSNPSTDNPKTINGAGTGVFTSNLTGLTGNTTYYVRAYVTTSTGTIYGNYVMFKTTPGLGVPTVTTTAPSAITTANAMSGGYINSDGGNSIIARGVCWSTNSNPVISGSKTIDGLGTGSFTSSISGLTAGTTYYVRAYATNNLGTAYGQQYHFTATAGASGNTFEYAGRTYTFKTIGSQTWMTENLAFLPSVSPPSTVSYSSPHYYVYNYNGSSVAAAKSNPNYTTYGVLYNWEAAKTACPPGWRLPSDADWNTLTNNLGASAGGKIKETGTTRWFSPNSGATNEIGFRALPAGHVYHTSGFFDLGHNTDFWTSTASGSSGAWYRGLAFNFPGVIRFYMQSSYGISVRCLKN